MNIKKTILILSAAALVFAAVFGVTAYRSAKAQEATPATTPPTAGKPPKDFDLAGFDRGRPAGRANEDLADALGISVAELDAARQKAAKAALDQAVEAGLITQAQADQLSDQGFAFPFGNRWAGWLSANGIDFDALLADALGITTDQLQEARETAHYARIDQAVADGLLTQEKADLLKGQYALFTDENFRASMQTAFETAVNEAVAGGVITQSQADQILKNQGNRGGPGFPGMEAPRGFGRRGRSGGFPPPFSP